MVSWGKVSESAPGFVRCAKCAALWMRECKLPDLTVPQAA